MKDLYIIGAGGFGREVAWLVERINAAESAKGNDRVWDLKGFIDDDVSRHGKMEDGYPVLGGCAYLKRCAENTEIYAVCAWDLRG